jgi:hypothetical protein
MDDQLFNQCHSSPEEGGNKGLFIDEKRGLLMISCEQVPLACFEINKILNSLPNQTEEEHISISGLQNEEKLIRLAINTRTDKIQNQSKFNDQINLLKKEIDDFINSKSWRITIVLRYLSYQFKRIFN